MHKLQVSFRLDQELLDQVDQDARKESRTRSSKLAQIVKTHYAQAASVKK